MKAGCINNTNFQGKLVITNRLSRKPNDSINKVKSDIEKLIQKKKYDLYVTQDYSKNEICFSANYPLIQKITQYANNLPINARASRYVDMAKNTIDMYEKELYNKEQKEWETKKKQQRIEDLKDITGTIVFSPLFVINDILHSINPKWSENFEKYIDKII